MYIIFLCENNFYYFLTYRYLVFCRMPPTRDCNDVPCGPQGGNVCPFMCWLVYVTVQYVVIVYLPFIRSY